MLRRLDQGLRINIVKNDEKIEREVNNQNCNLKY